MYLIKDIGHHFHGFLSQRLHEYHKNFIDCMNKFIRGRSTEIMQAVRIDVENLFGKHSVSSFMDDVISVCTAEQLPCYPRNEYIYCKTVSLFEILFATISIFQIGAVIYLLNTAQRWSRKSSLISHDVKK